ncbi:hypothetical protein CLAFUW4_01804 [Fulvia fulva]|uniref:Uncharacterized protein n=1 Tax=Passalora fulva TaxID=5499 RepID=A0A9Q8P3V2_PASFU|nr:uncharacterized protein CLAFUR5_01800 [Fulvia fulva]KAK4634434.1 hypothetical protein CLAFUR4_01802 [Fulvia fulva]KAK4638234.1 hypothetical protein CLAFUR0_01804 [Fulvia fulva]UJO12077.1 hypothetical protein CLAFUR5_01800 [Fulvia fulva]WPV10040.1 hypothetical protein CLAFUW4_01804 [Fulvia fulva]WPV23448.1 hypothetical protein CLAFUW7_01805 [Fulvia fulva]
MDRNNLSKKRQTPDWVHEMPCGDKSHAHENPIIEAAARAICRLPKLIIARKVDDVHQESPEHRNSVTLEMVARVQLEAERLVLEQEQCEVVETKQEEPKGAKQAHQDQRVQGAQQTDALNTTKDALEDDEVEAEGAGAGGVSVGQLENSATGEWETLDLKDAAEQSTDSGPDVEDWDIIGRGEVVANEAYIYRQVQSAQKKGCVLT